MLSWSQTLPIGLADVEEREEQENKENQNKVLEAPKKEAEFTGDSHTLLIALMKLEKHFQPEQPPILQTMMFS